MAAPRFLMPAILTLVMLIGLLGLGTWQMQRLQWKLQQIAKIEARQNTPPMSLQNQTDVAALTEAQHHYHPARLRGSFGPQQGFWYTQIHNPPSGITPQQRRGFHVLSPFYLVDGGAILIDRGFVPEVQKRRYRRRLKPRKRSILCCVGPINAACLMRMTRRLRTFLCARPRSHWPALAARVAACDW
jgi:cytochrome oxidase assembly protein ShyY1